MFAMVIEERFKTLVETNFVIALELWLRSLTALALFGFVFGFFIALRRSQHPGLAFQQTLSAFGTGLLDILMLPFGLRRVWAIATLSFKEAIRRRILYVFVMFLFPFLFAGWYLPNSEEGRLISLVAFVNGAITWILLPLVVFLSSMSLPNDLRTNTIYTIVTKPVRRLEIILGRIIGFMGIYTVVLVIMGGVSVLYLRGQIPPEIRAKQWTAKVPVLAQAPSERAGDENFIQRPLLFFKDGILGALGTHVGKEWEYRSHIEGASTDAAHFYFEFDPAVFKGRGLVPVESTFDIFKTTKGDPSRTVGDNPEKSGVFCLLTFIDRKTGHKLLTRQFRVLNNRITIISVPEEVFQSGKLEVTAQCLTRNQFLGMAPADLYFRANERTFEWNFMKGLFSIWLKVLLLTCVAVSASTVLNGFVTVLLTFTVYLLGFFHDFMIGIVSGEVKGGGPLESFIRLVTQNNQISPLAPTLTNDLAKSADQRLLDLMYAASCIVPNLSTLDTASYVAEGFDIPSGVIFRNVLIILGYVIPVIIAGYFFLKNREIAA